MQTRKAERTIALLESGSPVTMVAIGDSLTYGWLAEKGYLDFLQETLASRYPNSNLSILNRGIPGDTAEGGLQRLQADVIAIRPECVLIQFALNDAYTGYRPDRFAENIRAMVQVISRQINAETILITSVWIDSLPENKLALIFYQELEAVAEENQLPIAKVHEYWKLKINSGLKMARLVQPDGVHPTAAGYKVMAEAVAEVFEK